MSGDTPHHGHDAALLCHGVLLCRGALLCHRYQAGSSTSWALRALHLFLPIPLSQNGQSLQQHLWSVMCDNLL